jgi:long-subunit fatty acid transport protein
MDFTTVSGVHVVNTEYVDVTDKMSIDGGVNSINFGFGTRLYDNISFGVSANVYTGSCLSVFHRVANVENAIYDYRVIQTGTLVQDSMVVDTLKHSGVNFTIGFKYNGEKTNAALTVRTPFQMKVKYDQIVYNTYYFNGLVLDLLTETFYFGDNLVKYDMPWIVGTGFAHHVKENWLVALDAEMRAFKGGKINERVGLTINPPNNTEEYVEFDPRWNNVFTVRMGTEYLKETSLGTVPLRAGFAYIPTPEPNYDENGVASRANGYYGSLGTGIHWEQIHFDVAYSLYTIDVQYYDEFDYTNRNHHLNVSFTGVF